MKRLLILRLMAFAAVSIANTVEAEAANPKVALETSKGKIVIELSSDKAPATVKNFIEYVKSGFFDGTIFHRVIPNFMIQGGGFTSDMKKKPNNPPIKNEADNGLKNDRGTIAMARTNDPHSATSQFFINTKDNNFLNHTGKNAQGWGYAVFGRVVEGMDAIDAISAVKTGIKGYYRDVPVEPVVIDKVKILK